MRHAKLRIHRAVCAIDVGRVINPLGLRGAGHGRHPGRHLHGPGPGHPPAQRQVVETEPHGYPLAHMAQLPRQVEVIRVPSDAAPAGASTLAMPSAAPALASAVEAATTIHVRRLPLMPELLRKL